NDGRWLWSVDGSEKIFPLPSSETFRYLGLWNSMDLNWLKQIHVLNKYIADWKWKSLSNKIDPAQLRASYVEFLLPRSEIGLLQILLNRCATPGLHQLSTLLISEVVYRMAIPSIVWLFASSVIFRIYGCTQTRFE